MFRRYAAPREALDRGGYRWGSGTVPFLACPGGGLGVGPVAAALATAKALAEQAAPLVVSAGIGGAFPASGLRPGTWPSPA
ncbi:hypothetical protein ACFSC4_00845 [Deinococcus malanensis]|uniref:hypothetical protein n=1 Tax=Deinococcus malanensis TaxID=1706855 RepID=UPI0036439AA5